MHDHVLADDERAADDPSFGRVLARDEMAVAGIEEVQIALVVAYRDRVAEARGRSDVAQAQAVLSPDMRAGAPI